MAIWYFILYFKEVHSQTDRNLLLCHNYNGLNIDFC